MCPKCRSPRSNQKILLISRQRSRRIIISRTIAIIKINKTHQLSLKSKGRTLTLFQNMPTIWLHSLNKRVQIRETRLALSTNKSQSATSCNQGSKTLTNNNNNHHHSERQTLFSSSNNCSNRTNRSRVVIK